ncbi:MAG: hypothetical protein K2N87_12415 [Eubacterium sp.]|nr:hypothetical protein [Eubacterium sp.]
MRNLNSKLVMDFISEQGYDSVEKTYVAYTPLENYMCIAVAESYDNETEENSARIAVEAVLTAFEKKPSLKRLREYMQYANEQMILHSTRNELKVSLTVLVSDYTRMRYASCGNTRIYILYENLFTHISKTQTNYQQMLEQDAQEPPDGEQVHNLTEFLGKEKHARVFLSKIMELTEGSTILFATSNLWGRLSEIEILDAYEYTKTGREFLEILQELLLSLQEEYDQRMGSFTAAFLYIEKTFKEDIQKKKKRKRLLILIAAAIVVVALLVCLILLCMRALDRNQMREIEKHDQRGKRYMEYENYVKALEEYEQAVSLAEGINYKNWQYLERKRELSETVTDREALLILHQEAEAAFLSGEYEKAEKLYTQVQKEAAYQQFSSLAQNAGKKLEEIVARIQVLQQISLGDMYDSTQDYEEALLHYQRALNELTKIIDLELQGDVQAKIFGIRQKQKEAVQAEEEAKKAEEEAKQAEEEAKQEAAKQKAEEEAEQKAAAADRAVIKINTLLVNANSALDEGRTARARELYQQALSRYNKFTGSSEDADKLFQELTALGQAITEAEVKAKEEARETRIAQAAQYAIQAKEAARGGDSNTALALYQKALAIYQELNIWDEKTEAVYDAIDELENGTRQNPDDAQADGQSKAQGQSEEQNEPQE